MMSLLPSLLIAASMLPQGLMQQDRHSAPTHLFLKTLEWDSAAGAPVIASHLALKDTEAQKAGYYLVQGTPTSMQNLRNRIQTAGGEVFDYVPHNSFEVWLPSEALPAARNAGVALLPVHPGMKLDPEIGIYRTAEEDVAQRHLISVEIWPNQDLFDLEDQLRELNIPVLEVADSGRYSRALVRLNQEELLQVAHLPAVKWMEESATAEFRNDKSRWVIQTNVNNDVKLWLQGVTGQNVGIGHIDGRIYEASCYFDDPSGATPGPNHRKIKWWDSSGAGDGHGTHTAGSAAGNRHPVNGSYAGNGMAPDAFLVSHGRLPNSNEFGSMLLTAHNQGARIHTNSWGSDWTTAYNNWCRDIDTYSHDAEDGMVLIAVTNGNRLKNPENAKSAVGVGATDRNNQENHGSGGEGPTADGRLKPEVYAPGCSTFSARSGNPCDTRTMCGTSMACPVVAGGAALLKQYFEDGFYPSGSANAADAFVPSGSLLRACLANSGDDMAGVANYPNYKEGWGRILLDNVTYFTGDSRGLTVVDRYHANGVSQGQTHTYTVNIQNGSNLRVTMAFADEPGSALSSQPVVNNLNLTVIAPNGTRYHGNILDVQNNGESRTNPTKTDPKNTMESVLVANPQNGVWTVEVSGADVPVGPQGYAVVATY